MYSTYEPYSYAHVTQEEHDQCPVSHTMVMIHGVRVLGTQEPYLALSHKLVPSLVSQAPVPDREARKKARAEAVAAITVTTQAGNTFDGDEASQGRMARATETLKFLSARKQAGTPINLDAFGPCYQLLGDEYLCAWVLADNTPIYASENELREALALAGATQTALWVLD